MKTLLYIVILVAVLFVPVTRLDIAKLEPVEAVAVYLEDGLVKLRTDGGSVGVGETAIEALRDLKEKALSDIYLDTAQFLLVGENAERAAAQLKQYLRDNIRIGSYSGGDVKTEARYFSVHRETAKPGE